MVKIITAAILIASATPAFSATILSGDAQITAPAIDGARLKAGQTDGGSVIVNSGTILQLLSGSSTSQVSARPKLQLGDANTGSMLVEGAGTLVEFIGDNTGAKAEIGTDAGGNGALTIRNSAKVSFRDETLISGGEDVYINVGERFGSGEIIVDNASLELISSALTGIGLGAGLGDNGDGTLTLVNGANVLIQSNGATSNDPSAQLLVGRNDAPGARGMLTVENSVLSIDAGVGDAALSFAENSNVGIGEVRGSSALLSLSGNSSSIVNVGTGSGAIANLTVSDGAKLTADSNGFSLLQVGSAENAIGILSIETGGTVEITGPNSFARIGDSAPGAMTSSGLVQISGTGSILFVENEISVGNTSGFGTTVGIVSLNDGGILKTNQLVVGDGGVVQGSGGIIMADTILELGGIIAPGLSPGTLSFDGDLTINGGLLSLEFAGSSVGQFDVINMIDNLIVNGPFDLSLSFLGGYTPIVGQVFDFLFYDDLVGDFGNLANVTIFGLGEGSEFAFNFSDDGKIGLEAVTIVPSTVPLSPSIAFLLAGFAFLVRPTFKKRRTRKTLSMPKLVMVA